MHYLVEEGEGTPTIKYQFNLLFGINHNRWYFAVGGFTNAYYNLSQRITELVLWCWKLHPPPPQYCIFQFIPNNKLNWYFVVGDHQCHITVYGNNKLNGTFLWRAFTLLTKVPYIYPNNKIEWYFIVGVLHPPPPK